MDWLIFIRIKVEEQLEYVGDSHMVCMVDQFVKDMAVCIDSIKCFLLPIIHQT